jgi:hypothetical protein
LLPEYVRRPGQRFGRPPAPANDDLTDLVGSVYQTLQKAGAVATGAELFGGNREFRR